MGRVRPIRSRGPVRAVHVLAVVGLGVLVYAPASWGEVVRLPLATIGVPLAVVSGLVLWRHAAVRRAVGAEWLLLALTAAIGVAVLGQVLLQETFASVGHPVSLAAANTEPDAAVVRGWYAQLATQGTLGRMVATEIVDLLWIIGMAAASVLITLTVAALLRTRHPVVSRRLRRLAPYAALAPALDVLENGLSLVMLADPAGFPDWLAPAHATVSAAKLIAMVAVASLLLAYAAFGAIMGAGRRTESRRAGTDAEEVDALSPRLT